MSGEREGVLGILPPMNVVRRGVVRRRWEGVFLREQQVVRAHTKLSLTTNEDAVARAVAQVRGRKRFIAAIQEERKAFLKMMRNDFWIGDSVRAVNSICSSICGSNHNCARSKIDSALQKICF